MLKLSFELYSIKKKAKNKHFHGVFGRQSSSRITTTTKKAEEKHSRQISLWNTAEIQMVTHS